MHRWVLALALVGSTTGCSNRLLLYPSHDPLENFAEVIEVEATRKPIAGRQFQVFRELIGPADIEPAVTVLAFGGNGGRAELLVENLRRFFGADQTVRGCGIELLVVQYPGFGADDQPATLRGLGAGALDAWDWARARTEDRPIIVYGLSMGTTAALHVARTQAEADEPGPAGLILDRGPNIASLLLGKYGWWNLWLVAGPVAMSLPKSVHSRANAKRVGSTPALFILASEDHLASPRNANKIIAAYPGPKLVAWFDGHHNATISAGVDPIGAGVRWLWQRSTSCRK